MYMQPWKAQYQWGSREKMWIFDQKYRKLPVTRPADDRI